MTLRTKVLIVGGGPAGATAARILAENGVELILLERNFSFIKPCGGGVPSSAFNEFSLPKTLIKKEINGIRIVSPLGEKVDIPLREGSLVIVERGEFDKVLREEAEQKGAQTVEGEFVSFTGGNKYHVEASIGGTKAEIISEYIIAADGVNSRVRKSLGITSSQKLFAAYEHIAEVHTDICEFWFGSSHAPTLYSWVFPSVEGISIGTGSMDPGNIKALVNRFKQRRGITQEGRERIYRIPLWQGDLFNKDKILFTGDSAGQVLPLTYEGIYYAMKAGDLAARAIIEDEADNYKKMWKDRFQKRFILMDRLRDYFLKDDISAERLVALHKIPEIREASMNLWVGKDGSRESLLRYIKYFGKFLN